MKGKEGEFKGKFIFMLVVALSLVVGIFAASEIGGGDLTPIQPPEEPIQPPPNIRDEVSGRLDEIISPDLSGKVLSYVENFVLKRGIDSTQISNVSEVDFDSLPKEVNIENINNANLAIYKVDYDIDNNPATEDEQIYVITYSVNELRAQGDLIIAHDKRQILNFGYDGTMDESGFLETAAGVEGSLETGYVMIREGSITGISTSLEVVETSKKDINIIIYKNGKPIRFGNTLDASSIGIKEDYDVQSKDVVTFVPGDVISVYADGDAVWKDVITMIEITTTN